MTMELAASCSSARRASRSRRDSPRASNSRRFAPWSRGTRTDDDRPRTGGVANRITRCHFALTSGSGWSLELACVGVPQLLLCK